MLKYVRRMGLSPVVLQAAKRSAGAVRGQNRRVPDDTVWRRP